jgi:hypothetical protein
VEMTKEKLTRLLREAEGAHGQYEKEELGGERDAEWAAWYAEFKSLNALRERSEGPGRQQGFPRGA